MIRIRCQCGKKLKLPDTLVGKLAACPECRKKVRIVATEFHIETDAEKLGGMLVIEGGPQRTGEQLYLGGHTAIDVGKGDESVLRLRAESVSRHHCTLIPSDYGWRIEDQESTNGVYVNGRRIRGHNLLDGDLVHIGEFQLRYLTDPTKKRAEPPKSRRLMATSPASPESTAVPATEVDSELHLLETLSTMEETAAMKAPALHAAVAEQEVANGTFKLMDEPADTGPAVSMPIGEDGLCPQCRHELPPDARICVHCGTDLQTGKRLRTMGDVEDGSSGAKPGSIGAYVKDCVASLAFFTDAGSLVTFLVVAFIAAMNAVITLMPIIWLAKVIVQGWLFSFFFNVVLSAANGEKNIPELSLTEGWWDDIVAPLFKFVGSWAIVMAPAFGFATWIGYQAARSFAGGGGTSGISGTTEQILLALVGLGVFLWPITILCVAVVGFGPLFRPDQIAMTIARTFVPYVLTSIMTGLAISATYVVRLAMGSSGSVFGGSQIATECALWIMSAYCWIVAMRCIGLYYHHFKGRFAWSWG